MKEINRRRRETEQRLQDLRAKLSDAAGIIGDKACVYATGSFGRLEARGGSDLDLFIVGRRNGALSAGIEGSQLKRLDEICIKADLIEAVRSLGIPDFDGDGKYLVHYSVHEFTKTLGTPEDDVTNTFTARLLLLLEGKALLGDRVLKDIIEEVVAAYWRDYEDHKQDFVPAFFANDILRLWRTFCINYEARTEREPIANKLKGKTKNYKLKYSRMLTCYSALIYLLAVFKREGSVSPGHALHMNGLTPTQRLEDLLQQGHVSAAHAKISSLLDQYNDFLEKTSIPDADLARSFEDKERYKKFREDAEEFGATMFDAINLVGEGNRFHRILLV